MKWFSIYKDGHPISEKKVLTFSEIHRRNQDLAYRLMDGQFTRLCNEVTHYAYLEEPEED